MKPVVIIATDGPKTIILQLAVLDATTPGAEILVSPYGGKTGEIVDAVQSFSPSSTMTVGTAYELPNPANTWADAVNIGARSAATQSCSHYAILADDAVVFPGWLDGLIAATEAKRVIRIGDNKGTAAYRVGYAGPVTTHSRYGDQRLRLTEGEADMGLAEYAAARAGHFDGTTTQAEAVELWCVAFRRNCFLALCGNGQQLIKPLLGRFMPDDIAIRAADNGWRPAVAESVFAGRRSPAATPLDAPPDVDDRLRFYADNRKERGFCDEQIIAGTVVRLQDTIDLHRLRQWLLRHAEVADDLVFVLANNPDDMRDMKDLDGECGPDEIKMLDKCRESDEMGCAAEVQKWAIKTLKDFNRTAKVAVAAYPDAPDRRLELGMLLKEARYAAMSDTNPWFLHVDLDELLEPRVGRSFLRSLAQHPNPSVLAYDFEIMTCWSKPELIREDAPYGDSGTYRGGPSAIRFWSLRNPRGIYHAFRETPQINTLGRRDSSATIVPDSPAFGESAVRIANIRLLSQAKMTVEDRARRKFTDDKQEGMRFTKFNPANGIGLHMLTFHREPTEDIARWLDDVHGLVDAAVFVWTDPVETCAPPEDLRSIVHLHDANLVLHPLDDHIAEARNAGIRALGTVPNLNFALFFDPDEWLGDLAADCRSIRRMSMSPKRFGFLLKVRNHRTEGTPTISDSVRMSRLNDGYGSLLLMNGRVHESFGDGILGIQKRGIHPGLLYAPFVLEHRGMAYSPARMGEKHNHYERMLRLELAENPNNPGAWVSLGLHYANDGHVDETLECYRRSVECAGNTYLPFKEMAFYHLREARKLINQCQDRLAPAHPFSPVADRLSDFLNRYAASQPIVQSDAQTSTPRPLPDFPTG